MKVIYVAVERIW